MRFFFFVAFLLFLPLFLDLSWGQGQFKAIEGAPFDSFGDNFKRGQWVVGVSLEGGLALTGSDLVANEHGLRGPGDWVYTPVGATINLSCWLSPAIALSSSVGFMTAKLPDRSSSRFSRSSQPWEQPWFSSRADWNISFIPLSLSLTNRKSATYGKIKIKGAGAEFYYSTGRVSSDFSRRNRSSNVYEYEHITASQKGIGAGVFGFWGYQGQIKGSLLWQALILARIGGTKEISHTSQSDINWNPISLQTTGFYVKIGINQSLN